MSRVQHRQNLLRRRIASTALLVMSLCAGILGAGCNGNENSPPVKTQQSADQLQTKSKTQGGGVDDMSVVPAPPGVKTGIEGGKK
jgi:hypothetical protein